MKHTPRTLHIVFTGIVLTIIALPVAFFDTTQTISEKEKRTLAEKPPLLRENQLNATLFSEYDRYFQDHLGFRERLIQLDAMNPLSISAELTLKHAIEGKDGWYFYINRTDGNNLMDFYKRNLLHDAQLQQLSDRFATVCKWCDEQNIPILFIIGPNKHSVYAEYYPFSPRPAGITRADQITALLDELGAVYVFPRDYLLEKKAAFDVPLYYETDTHWNPLGAALTFCLIKAKLKALLPTAAFPEILYTLNVTHSTTIGDLLPMLNITSASCTAPSVLPSNGHSSDYYTYVKNEGRNGVHTKSVNQQLPRALIFRDSFCSALEQFLSPLFGEAEYLWRDFSPADKSYVRHYKPDIIIVECVERQAAYMLRQW